MLALMMDMMKAMEVAGMMGLMRISLMLRQWHSSKV